MTLNLWSVLLIASASQCVFLIAFFLLRPSTNKTATRLMILLLVILLFMNVSNLWYAARLYLEVPYLTGIGRGTTLLIGPAIYLYVLSVVRPGFKLQWKHSLHLSGYMLGLILLVAQPSGANVSDAMQQVEAFLMNGIRTTPLVLTRFALYALHLTTYLFLSRRIVLSAEHTFSEDYLISKTSRIKWLRKLNLVMIAIAVAVIWFFIDAMVTHYYSADANYINTLIYSAFVYLIAYQALSDEKNLIPDFKIKYQSGGKISKDKSLLTEQLNILFNEQRIFVNPDLTQASVASMLEIPPHQFSALLNRELNKTFFELVNEYRVQAFIEVSKDHQFDHLSIMGKAQEVGFRSKSSFNTAFKKIKGKTPSDYLKNLQY